MRHLKRGKVRDIFEVGDNLLMVTSDRISAFDWVLPNEVPDKGRVLTQLSVFWLNLLGTPNHLIATNLEKMGLPPDFCTDGLDGRSMLVRKANVVPIECVVRGYLAGSGWKEYQQSQTVCGIQLPPGLTESAKLDKPIFTPATKAEIGHDENISFGEMCKIVGRDTAMQLRRKSLEVYQQGAEYALKSGIIIADTKFEWGWFDGRLILIDEVLTPDSSRFWPADLYEPGRGQMSFDKQFLRDWLETTDWDKNSTPPAMTPNVVDRTRTKYIQAYQQLTGKSFAWK